MQNDTSLVALSVEGLSPVDPKNKNNIEIADTVEYFGKAPTFEDCDVCRVCQFKYSVEDANNPFTWSYLTKTLTKFAAVYVDHINEFGETKANDRLKFAFITNRQPKITTGISGLFANKITTETISQLYSYGQRALVDLNLKPGTLVGFLNRCELITSPETLGGINRAISAGLFDLTAGPDPKGLFNNLVALVLDKAGVSASGNNLIEKQDVLGSLGVKFEEDLLPAPSEFVELGYIEARDEEVSALAHIITVDEPLVVVADGGVGKTVFLQSLAKSLQGEHVPVLFDCFAGGKYRKSDGHRHSARVGLLHIVNTLAARGLCDPILPLGDDQKKIYQRVKQRIYQATASLKRLSPGGKIVLFIDAADNAAEFAGSLGEDCFVHWLLGDCAEGKFPGLNLVLSCRGYRFNVTVGLARVKKIELAKLNLKQTQNIVASHSSAEKQLDARLLHAQSGGNPRVLDYLLKVDPIAFDGKKAVKLDDIFDEQLRKSKNILKDQGFTDEAINLVLAAFARLRPPIPIDELAVALEVEPGCVRSLATDLSPLISLSKAGLTFRDENAEAWLRKRYSVGTAQTGSMCERLISRQENSVYAASIVPSLLVELNRLKALEDLAFGEIMPLGLLSRSAKQRLKTVRMRALLKLSVKSENIGLTLRALIALGMLKTVDERRSEYIVQHFDLAALVAADDVTRTLKNRRDASAGEIAGCLSIYHIINGDLDSALPWLNKFNHWTRWFLKNQSKANNPSILAWISPYLAGLAQNQCDSVIERLESWYPPQFNYRLTKKSISSSHFLECSTIDNHFTSLLRSWAKSPSLPYKSGMKDDQGKEVRAYGGVELALFENVDIRSKHAVTLRQIAARIIHLITKPQTDSYTYRTTPDPMVQAFNLFALKSMAMDAKADTKRFSLGAPSSEVSLYRFSGNFQSGPFGPFVAARVLAAYSSNRSFCLWDCLPASIRSRTTISSMLNEDLLKKELSRLAKKYADFLARNQSKRTNRTKTKNPCTPISIEQDEIPTLIFQVTEIEAFGKILDKAVRRKTGVTCKDIEYVLDRTLSKPNSSFHYQLRPSAEASRIEIGREVLNYLLALAPNRKRLLENIAVAIDSRINNKNWRHDTEFTLIHALGRQHAWHESAGKLATNAAGQVPLLDTVGERSSSFASLARAVIRFDRDSARELFRQGLDMLDGVGGDDFAIVNGLLGVTATQKGGLISPRLSHRFMNLCEINFVHEPEKFDWEGFARSVSLTLGLDALPHMTRWDDRDVAGLHLGMTLSLMSLVKANLINPNRAAALMHIAPCRWEYGQNTANKYFEIFEAVEPSIKEYVAEDFLKLLLADIVPSRVGEFKQAVLTSLPSLKKHDGISRLEISTEAVTTTKAPKYREKKVSIDKKTRQKIAKIKNVNLQTSAGIDNLVSGLGEKLYNPSTLQILEILAEETLKPIHADKFLDAVFLSRTLSHNQRKNLIEHVWPVWERSSVALKAKRRGLASRLLSDGLSGAVTSDFGLQYYLSDIADFGKCSASELALEVAEMLTREDVNFNSPDAFSIAQEIASTSSGPSARQGLEYILEMETFNNDTGYAEGVYDSKFSLSSASEEKVSAGLVWHQLGHVNARARWRASHAVACFAKYGLLEDMIALVELFKGQSSGTYCSSGIKFNVWNAREWMLHGCLRSARVAPASMESLRTFLIDLSNGLFKHAILIRLATDTLALMDHSLNNSGATTLSLGTAPVPTLSALPQVPGFRGGGDGRASHSGSDGKRFYFEYEFTKREPKRLADVFGLSVDDAGTAIIDEVRDEDSTLERMSNFGGRPKPWRYDSRGASERFEYYGAHQVRHARLRAATEFLSTHRVRSSNETSNAVWEYYLNEDLTTYPDGRRLIDGTTAAPLFVNTSVTEDVNKTRKVKTPQAWLESLGFLGRSNRSDFLPIWGGWHTPDGASISLQSALCNPWGSISRCRELAKLGYHDVWMPEDEPARSYYSDVAKARYQNFRGWVRVPEDGSSAGIDRWDPFGTPKAAFKPVLSPAWTSRLGLTCCEQYNDRWLNSNGKIVLKSIAWGKLTDRDEKGEFSSGEVLLAERDWLMKTLNSLDCDLVLSGCIYRYKSSNYGESEKTIFGGHVIKLSKTNDVRTWKISTTNGSY